MQKVPVRRLASSCPARAGATAAIWALAVSAMWAPGEAPSEHVAVVQDISARKAAEQRSQQARAELESTLAALPDLLFDLDDEGRIYDFRAPHPELLAARPEVFLGRTMRDVLPPDVAVIIEGAINEALRHGYSSGARYRLALAGGDRWFELSAARKHVDGGQRLLDRAQVAGADVDHRDHDVSVPLVDGTAPASRGSMRVA